MRAALFPGQGTQRPGMGERFAYLSPGARDVYAMASDVLGRDVAALCFRGSAESLRDTRNAQVAVVVTGLAGYALATELGFVPDVVAGHSVGELAAVVACGALAPEDAVRAVDVRAQLMGSLPRTGGMAALTGVTRGDVAAICAEVSRAPDDLLTVAVSNASTVTVVSGHESALERLETRLAARRVAGAKISRLAVSHAFHSPLMQPVADAWRSYLAGLPVHDASIPLVANVTASPLTAAADIARELADQVTSPVDWTGTTATLRAMGVSTALEVGDSRVLTGLCRGVDGLQAMSLSETRTLKALSAAPTLS